MSDKLGGAAGEKELWNSVLEGLGVTTKHFRTFDLEADIWTQNLQNRKHVSNYSTTTFDFSRL
jgi:hypothetical protein